MSTRSALREQQTHTRSPWRWLISALIILAWLAAASFGGPLFGKIDEVSSNDQTAYLPESADATTVQTALDDFLGSDAIPAVVVFASDSQIDESLQAELSDALSAATDAEGILEGTSPVLVSDDGEAAQAFVPIAADGEVGEITATLSESLRESVPAGIDVYITGPAGFTADLIAGFVQVSDAEVGSAYLRAVEGIGTGRILPVG